MTIDSAELTMWLVSEQGYRLEPRIHDNGSERSSIFVVRNSQKSRMYNPLNHPELPSEFVDTCVSDSGVLEFANKWGELGGDTPILSYSSKEGRIQGFTPLSTWYEEHVKVKKVMELVTLGILETDSKFAVDDNKLESYIKRGKNWVAWFWSNGDSIGFRTDTHAQVWHLISKSNVDARVNLARLVYQRLLNEGLQNRVNYQIFREANSTKLAGFIAPKGLIGAIWYLLSRNISQNGYRRCGYCNSTFRPKHKDSAYCNSNSCRSKQRRIRKAMT